LAKALRGDGTGRIDTKALQTAINTAKMHGVKSFDTDINIEIAKRVLNEAK
jgi:hypothetical protein